MKPSLNRRHFLAASAATTSAAFTVNTASAADDRPALLGGEAVRHKSFPAWPVSDGHEEIALLDVLRSGKWYRGGAPKVAEFEAAYAQLMGTSHCVATANGTSALIASLGALEIGPGDEVIVPPYTFIATINAVLLHYALPVFVDTDPATFQIDATKVEPAITERTRALLPVHLGGNVADLDSLLATAAKHDIPLIEDACQSHLAEWKGKKVGSLGTTGCFSFQVTKNLPSGEGGAIITSNPELAARCYAFHNNGRPPAATGYDFTYLGGRGANLRLTEFQGAILLAQMARLEQQSRTREQNAQYLTAQLNEIPGIAPARQYEGTTRNAYHLYMFRYTPEAFGGLPRDRFLKALSAEGVPCSGGYSPLNKDDFLTQALDSRGFKRIYSKTTLDDYKARNHCPANDALCQEAVWFTQPMLLGPREDMDQIASAIRKLQKHSGALARA